MIPLDIRRRSRRHRRVRTRLWVSYGVDSIDSAGDSQNMPRVQKVYGNFKRGLEMIEKIFAPKDASN